MSKNREKKKRAKIYQTWYFDHIIGGSLRDAMKQQRNKQRQAMPYRADFRDCLLAVDASIN